MTAMVRRENFIVTISMVEIREGGQGERVEGGL